MKKKRELFTQILWLFIIGCLTGYILETIWYFIKHGIWINKQGLLYGPFKPVYGLGVLVITSIFTLIKNKTNIKVFLLGIVIGTVYEYLLSLFQEFVLKTSTWNYAKFNFNLNGRVYLPYCIVWGIISLIWVNFIYPKIKKDINKIPLWLSIIVAIFIISNLIVSAIAVYEYSNRANNIHYNSKILNAVDEIYPDEVMKKKYPKLKAIKKQKNY